MPFGKGELCCTKSLIECGICAWSTPHLQMKRFSSHAGRERETESVGMNFKNADT